MAGVKIVVLFIILNSPQEVQYTFIVLFSDSKLLLKVHLQKLSTYWVVLFTVPNSL